MAWSHRTLKHIKQDIKNIKIVKQHAPKRKSPNHRASDLLLFNDKKIIKSSQQLANGRLDGDCHRIPKAVRSHERLFTDR